MMIMLRILCLILSLLRDRLVLGQQSNSSIFNSINPSMPTCSLNSYCVLNDRINYLEINCDSTVLEFGSTNCALADWIASRIGSININFQENKILNSNLPGMINLMNIVYFKSQASESNVGFSITEQGLERIDLAIFEPFTLLESLARLKNNLSLVIIEGTFDLYYKKRSLGKPEMCNSEIYQKLLTKSGEHFLNLFPDITISGTRFRQKLCKFLFQNLSIESLWIARYIFEITQGSKSKLLTPKSLNSSIYKVYISNIRKLDLSTKILDPDVFRSIKILQIQLCSVYRIQQDIFKNQFHSIKYISIEPTNLCGMLHGYAGVAWIKNINFNRKPIDLAMDYTTNTENDSPNSTKYIMNAYDAYGIQIRLNIQVVDMPYNYSKNAFPYSNYQFPDEDFCLFYDIPLERLVFIDINGLPNNISCTVAWLYRYQHIYQNILPVYITS